MLQKYAYARSRQPNDFRWFVLPVPYIFAIRVLVAADDNWRTGGHQSIYVECHNGCKIIIFEEVDAIYLLVSLNADSIRPIGNNSWNPWCSLKSDQIFGNVGHAELNTVYY